MEKGQLGETNDNVLIRDLRKSDLKYLLDLYLTCFANEFEVSGFDPDHMADMVNRGFGVTGRLVMGLLRFFGKEPVRLLVAEIGGRVVGTTIVSPGEKSGYISSVMVHPDFRRKGIATRLVTSALDYIRKKNKVRAVLHVDSTNDSAISIYVKLGFKAFERSTYFIGETDSVHVQENTSRVKIREFQKEDLDQVYDLIESSEDPNNLRIFDFTRKTLKTPFLQRMFHFAIRKQLVAMLDSRIVGYAEAEYGTPKEAGRIRSIHANPEDRSLGIEKLLIEAARGEIAKAGIGRVRITVPTANQELMQTVKDLGFKQALVMDAMVAELQ
jgi:ribosomal-protein-alanine N-acetyltransferase